MGRIEPALDRDLLVSAALAQLEEDGLAGLSMGRIAARLGVQPPALYWHVKNKAELLGLMSYEIYRAATEAAPMAPHWRAWLIGFGYALRSTLTSRRDAALLFALAPPYEMADLARYADQRVEPLVGLGIGRDRAVSFQASVVALTLGWAIGEANKPMHHFLGRILDFEESFASSLTALVEGLKERPDEPAGMGASHEAV